MNHNAPFQQTARGGMKHRSTTGLRRRWLFFFLALVRGAVTAAKYSAALRDKGPPPPALPFEPLTYTPECLPCEDTFARLEGMVHHVDMVERGEPKSGTGGMFEWAMGALFHVCQHLNQHYGRESCIIEWGRWSPGDFYGNHTLVFEPPLEQPDDAPCSCTGVRRATITVCKMGKHALPVEESCPFSHNLGFDLYPQFCEQGGKGGGPAANCGDIWRCIEGAQCQVVDDRLQMVIFRDPRPAVVSSFYFLKTQNFIGGGVGIDEFVQDRFPGFCKWMAIRLGLFKRAMAKDKVAVFWYEEWQTDAVKWHRRFFKAVGLEVPEGVLHSAVQGALANDFPFFTKGHDPHAGGVIPPAGSSYRDEISNDTARIIDETMRQWLPRDLLVKLDSSFV